MRSDPLFNLQALRAIAAIMVVFHHLQAMVSDAFGPFTQSAYGAFGVDIFFVVSGFIMFYSNQNFQKSSGYFLQSRLWRIVPLYWIATLFIVALYIVGFRPNGLMHIDLGILTSSLLFFPNEFPGNRHDLVLNLGWTLMYELFFYAAFAVTFALKSLARSFGILCIGFAALILSRFVVDSPIYLADFFRRPILLEFLYGAAFAILYIRFVKHPLMRSVRAGVLLIIAGFLTPIPTIAVLGEMALAPDGLRFLVLGIPALAVVAGCLILENADLRVKSRSVLLLGAASYALYLFHPALLQGTVKVAAAVLPRADVSSAMLAVILAMSVAFVGAIFIHLTLERPILALGQRLTWRPVNAPSVLEAKGAHVDRQPLTPTMRVSSGSPAAFGVTAP